MSGDKAMERGYVATHAFSTYLADICFVENWESMLINEGKYIGTGVYRLDKKTSMHRIECIQDISIKPKIQ